MKYLKHFFTVVSTVVVLLLANVSNADDVSNQAKTTKEHAEQLVQWLDFIGDPKNPMTLADVDKHFASNFKQYTNGKLVAKKVDGAYKRFNAIRSQYELAHIQLPPQDILVDGNKAAMRYVVEFKNKEGKTRVNDIIIFKFNNDGKVAEIWESFDAGDPAK